MLNIRMLGYEDESCYRALWLGALTEQSQFFRTAAEDESCPAIPTRSSRDSFTLGAFTGSQLVGIVSLNRDKGAKLRHKALLSRMFVHPCAAGQGVGKALLHEVITHANAIDDLRQIHLTVLATNQRARALYGGMGFQNFVLEPGAVKIGDQYVDEVQMVLLLHRGP